MKAFGCVDLNNLKKIILKLILLLLLDYYLICIYVCMYVWWHKKGEITILNVSMVAPRSTSRWFWQHWGTRSSISICLLVRSLRIRIQATPYSRQSCRGSTLTPLDSWNQLDRNRTKCSLGLCIGVSQDPAKFHENHHFREAAPLWRLVTLCRNAKFRRFAIYAYDWLGLRKLRSK